MMLRKIIPTNGMLSSRAIFLHQGIAADAFAVFFPNLRQGVGIDWNVNQKGCEDCAKGKYAKANRKGYKKRILLINWLIIS
jgi:hypothetical protein